MAILLFILLQVRQAVAELLAIAPVVQAFGRHHAQRHFRNNAKRSQ